MSINWVKLSEIAQTSSGGTPPRGNKNYYGGKIAWLKSGELPDGEIYSCEETITEEGLRYSSTNLKPPGTLLMAMYGATVGKLGILTFSAATNQAVCAIAPTDALDTNYLFYWLLNIRKNLIKASFGGAQPNLSQSVIQNLEIPLVLIDKQRQIAAKLKTQLVEVEAARNALECQKQEIVNLANAYIRESIEQSSKPVGAGLARDSNLAYDLNNAVTHSRARPAPTDVETAGNALAWQQQEIINLANAYIRESIAQPSKPVGAGLARDLDNVCYLNDVATDSRARPAPTFETRLGDVLEEVKQGIGANWADYPVLGATRNGLAPAKEPPGKYPQRYKPVFSGTVFYNPMRIMIGSIAFVDDDDAPGITSPDYVALRGKAGVVDSRWFYYWLRSPYGVQCINSLARGAVRERMLFNRLAEGSILLPLYEEQLRVSKALAQLKSVKSGIQKQLDELNKIPERLLAQAFGNNY